MGASCKDIFMELWKLFCMWHRVDIMVAQMLEIAVFVKFSVKMTNKNTQVCHLLDVAYTHMTSTLL